MSYLLDTNVCVDLFKGDAGVSAKLARANPADCAVSAITAYELSMGLRRTAQRLREEQKLQRLFSVVEVLPFDGAAGNESAGVRDFLERTGVKIGPYDVLIAGHALAARRILVTSNVGEFSRVPELVVENWRG